jgi:hypothetical protein
MIYSVIIRGDKMIRYYSIVFLLSLLMVLMLGCSSNEKNTFTISGKIEKIDAAYIFVDDFPIPIKDTSSYSVGQNIKAELYSASDTDVYNPELIKLKSIEILE